MQSTLRLSHSLQASVRMHSHDEPQLRHRLVAARQRTHSVQEAERLDLALRLPLGAAHDGMRRRCDASVDRPNRGGIAVPNAIAQWHMSALELITCEGAYLKVQVTIEAFWCEALAQEVGLDTELAAAVAEDIANDASRLLEQLRQEYADAIAVWVVDCAPAALHAKEQLKLEVSVALMNELYGGWLHQPMAA